ncbi:14088_t:CDS:2 [Funneliformis caledonium]|uniref:14088_t:CDS:1 n=1 Tax=Funneliformis caledonium TaxID=1117310 RepID=A0A9N9DWF5_9GLOM|nr:14088_t:CDS:2 [Funneliformis caledonium]
MLKNYSIRLVLWLLIQLLVEVKCQTTPFRSTQRSSHTATLIDSNLYILGGRNDETGRIGNEFFYLDVSVPFNTQNILWHNLTSINIVPAHISAASVNGGANNKTLFLYGGSSDKVMSLVYTFDTQSNSWNIPKITGDNIVRKNNLKGIINNYGKMYLFGGLFNGTTTQNDMFILDTKNLKWELGSTINAPSPRAVYGATYVSEQHILYLGGFSTASSIDGASLSLKEIYYYDMLKDLWLTRVTSGTIPTDRDSFSAVLGLNGQKVIIFGGINNINKFTPQDTLYVLDLNNFEWYIPKISGSIPSSRYWHQANVIGKYMVISFGFGYDRNIDNDILLLDISNDEEYMWTNIFDPNEVKPTPPTESPKVSPTTTPIPVIIGVSIGTCVVIISLLIGGFYLYKWHKNKTENSRAIPTPGSEGNNNFNHEAFKITTRNSVYNHG